MIREVLYEGDCIFADLSSDSDTIRVFTRSPYKDFAKTIDYSDCVVFEKNVPRDSICTVNFYFFCRIAGRDFMLIRLYEDTLFVDGQIPDNLLPVYMNDLNLTLWSDEEDEPGWYQMQVPFSLVDKYFLVTVETDSDTPIHRELSMPEFFREYRRYYCPPVYTSIRKFLRQNTDLNDKLFEADFELLSSHYAVMQEIQYTLKTGRIVGPEEDPVRFDGQCIYDSCKRTGISFISAYIAAVLMHGIKSP